MSDENLLDDVIETGNSKGITQNMKNSMQGTAPWMKFLGIVFIVFGGLGVISGLFSFTASPIGGLIMLAITGLYVYMGYLIYKSGSEYTSFLTRGDTRSLESSLENQKKWWLIMGILMIIVIVFYIGMLIFGLSAGGFGGMRRF